MKYLDKEIIKYIKFVELSRDAEECMTSAELEIIKIQIYCLLKSGRDSVMFNDKKCLKIFGKETKILSLLIYFSTIILTISGLDKNYCFSFSYILYNKKNEIFSSKFN